MKRFALLSMLFLPLATMAQKQYYLPTTTPSDEEKDKPMIEVYLPNSLMVVPSCYVLVVLCGGCHGRVTW